MDGVLGPGVFMEPFVSESAAVQQMETSSSLSSLFSFPRGSLKGEIMVDEDKVKDWRAGNFN